METNLDKSKEVNYLLKHLLRTGANLEKAGNRILSEYHLNQQQFIVLNEIVRKKTMTPNEIVLELGYEKSNISKIIKKLKVLKYLESVLNPDDHRSIILKPTTIGIKIWKQGIHKLNKDNNIMFQKISIEDIIIMKESVHMISNIIFRK
ncbi:MAG: MarR family transcriptional regulator [Leptospirales bacterium]